MEAHTRVTISLPRGLATRLERLRRSEHRTRSGLLQEALRAYLEARGGATQPRKANAPQARRTRSPTTGTDPRLQELMAARMVEQDSLSQGLLALRDAMARKRKTSPTK